MYRRRHLSALKHLPARHLPAKKFISHIFLMRESTHHLLDLLMNAEDYRLPELLMKEDYHHPLDLMVHKDLMQALYYLQHGVCHLEP
jgi:hypothetical protein